MAQDPHMTPVEQEIEDALRSLRPAHTVLGGTEAAKVDLAFALGRASMTRSVRRWQIGSGMLAVFALAAASLSLGSEHAPASMVANADDSHADQGGGVEAVTRDVSRDIGAASTEFTAVTQFDAGSTLRLAFAIPPYQKNMLKQAAVSFDGDRGSTDPALGGELTPTPIRRTAPVSQTSLDFFMELLAARERSS